MERRELGRQPRREEAERHQPAGPARRPERDERERRTHDRDDENQASCSRTTVAATRCSPTGTGSRPGIAASRPSIPGRHRLPSHRRSDAAPHRARRRLPRARDARRRTCRSWASPSSTRRRPRAGSVLRAGARAARRRACISCRRCGAGSSRCRSACTCRSWIEDPDFDLDYHLRRAALPAPGGETRARRVRRRRREPPARPQPAAVGGVRRRGSRARLPRVRHKLHHSLIDGVVGRRDPRRRCSTSSRHAEPKVADIAPTSGSRSTSRATSRCSATPRSRSRSARCSSCKAANNLGRSVVRGRAARARARARRAAAAHRAAAVDEPHRSRRTARSRSRRSRSPTSRR